MFSLSFSLRVKRGELILGLLGGSGSVSNITGGDGSGLCGLKGKYTEVFVCAFSGNVVYGSLMGMVNLILIVSPLIHIFTLYRTEKAESNDIFPSGNRSSLSGRLPLVIQRKRRINYISPP